MDHELNRLTRRLCLDRDERLHPDRWRPAADVYRTRNGWLVKMELAGIDPDAIEVTTRGRLLLVRGQRRDVVLEECQACHSMEITYSGFGRAIELPADLDDARIASDYRRGMLLVTITLEFHPS